jgi:hypothetical protein
MSWLFRDKTIDMETIDEIERQADRGAAIISCGYLEEFLLTAIKSVLVDDEKAIKRMFTGMGPLATFSANVETAYLLQIITKDTVQSLHQIGGIRNDFAHKLQALTFDTPDIKNRCKELLWAEQVKEFWKQSTVTFKENPEALELINKLFVPMFVLPDTPRNAYLNSIKVLIFYLGTEIFKRTGQLALKHNAPSAPQSNHQRVQESSTRGRPES